MAPPTNANSSFHLGAYFSKVSSVLNIWISFSKKLDYIAFSSLAVFCYFSHIFLSPFYGNNCISEILFLMAAEYMDIQYDSSSSLMLGI